MLGFISPGPMELLILMALGGLSPGAFPLSVPPLPEDKPLVSAAPEECLFYLSWYGSADPKSSSANQVEQLLAEPEVQQFIAAIWKEMNAALDRQGDPMVKTIFPIAKTVLTRPTSIFISKFEARLKGPGLPDIDVSAGVIVNAGDAARELEQALRKFERMLPGEVGEVTVEGVKLRKLPLPPKAPSVQWGFYKQYLVIAVGDGTAKKIISSLKAARGPPTWLKKIHQRLAVQRPSLVQYVNLKGILKAGLKTAGPQGAIVKKGLAALGLDNVESLSFVSGLDKFDMVTKTLLATEGKPRGVLTLVSDKPLKAADLAAIPRDASFAFVNRFDAAAAYKLVFDTIGKFDPNVRDIAEATVDDLENVIGLDILKDLLQPLGDTWTLHNAPSQGGWLFTGLCATVTLRDRERFEKTHNKILQKIRDRFPPGRNPIREFTFRGQKVYLLNIDAPVPLAPAWCLTDKQLIVALYPQTIKAHLTRTKNDPSLADVPEVAALLKQRPSSIDYQNTPEMVRAFYPWVQVMAPMAFSELRKAGVDLDASILPSARAIYPHIRPAVGMVSRTNQGILSVRHQSSPGAMGSMTMAPIAIALILPAVQAAREAARRTHSLNNLHQLAIGMHNYHNTFNSLPAPANYDKNGKPLLSWRVHLLPYLERNDLYKRFHLDEPWDSEHNRKLIKEMPSLYRIPGYTEGNKTSYLVPRGDNTMFPKGKAGSARGITFGQVTDGLSNTIMIVEASPDSAVIWTKPDDWNFDAKNPKRRLVGYRPNLFIAALGDGSVRVIKENIAARTLKGLFTRSGGEFVRIP